MKYLRALPDAPDIVAESALRVRLSNGSQIVALPGDEKTIRGFGGVSLAILDEAARIDDALMAAVRPMLLTSNGRLIALSTPHGRRGFFYTAWHGDESWHRVRVSADQCPRITPEQLAEELRELGEIRYAEEFLLEFVEDGQAVIRTEFFERAISTEVSRLWP
jgi:hypothetical protein